MRIGQLAPVPLSLLRLLLSLRFQHSLWAAPGQVCSAWYSPESYSPALQLCLSLACVQESSMLCKLCCSRLPSAAQQLIEIKCRTVSWYWAWIELFHMIQEGWDVGHGACSHSWNSIIVDKACSRGEALQLSKLNIAGNIDGNHSVDIDILSKILSWHIGIPNPYFLTLAKSYQSYVVADSQLWLVHTFSSFAFASACALPSPALCASAKSFRSNSYFMVNWTAIIEKMLWSKWK